MKLLRFGEPGREKPGLLRTDGSIGDLTGLIQDVAGQALLPASIDRLRGVNAESLPRVDISGVSGGVRLGPCVGAVGKFICIGLNYADHAAESNMAVPVEPILFMKATSAICGPNDQVEIPRGSVKTDWEVELGVVIGAPAKHVSQADALAHVAGYCVVNDLSERAFQLEGTGQWVKGKSADTFGPIGPWLVTADEVADPQKLALWLEVDGRTYQRGSTDTMIFGVAFLVSYVSRFMSLQPGDIISTGTPPGIGMGQKPPMYLKPGHRIRLGIDGLGEQNQLVVG
jgi:2-keto-4-pentenoate hydratase/2-oxohepta-3-ene-1,7-dioic acid hydratase in catechol pathway